jgi:hypothetical protein
MKTVGTGTGKNYETGWALHFKNGGGKVTGFQRHDDTGAVAHAIR